MNTLPPMEQIPVMQNSNEMNNNINIMPQNSMSLQNQQMIQNEQTLPMMQMKERHRRSKHDPEGRIYQCHCGKSYLSQPALNNHKKSKHPELFQQGEQRGRGRPRKIKKGIQYEFEKKVYVNFFNSEDRKKEEGKTEDYKPIYDSLFTELYTGENAEKMFKKLEKIEDNFILNSLKNNVNIESFDKNNLNCDQILYMYIKEFQDKMNAKYFQLFLKFVLLFRESFNFSKFINVDNSDKECSSSQNAEKIPELCNEFYSFFLDKNNFFGIEEDKRNDIIELIQHLCTWLFANKYTKSKLSLVQ